MKKQLLSIIIILTPFSTYSCSIKIALNDRIKAGLKGKVKSYEEKDSYQKERGSGHYGIFFYQ